MKTVEKHFTLYEIQQTLFRHIINITKHFALSKNIKAPLCYCLTAVSQSESDGVFEAWIVLMD